jgi:polyisoprenoid-binding protein YceI
MRTLTGIVGAILVVSPVLVSGQSPEQAVRDLYAVDGQHSTVGFTAKLAGIIKVRGRFRAYDIAVTLDSVHRERSSVTAIILTKSIDTDMEFRDNHLRSADFFDVERFPAIEFRSERVTLKGPDVQVTGPLTMHGVTRTISFLAHVTPVPPLGSSGDRNVELEADLRLSMKDYAIAGTNKFNPSYNPATNLLADSVDINLELMAQHQGYLDQRIWPSTPPSIADTVLKVLDQAGPAAAVATYRSVKASDSAAFHFSAGQLDHLAHILMARGRVADALPLLRLNVEMYPSIGGVFESLSEAEALAGDRRSALRDYHQAAALDSTSASARQMLRVLEAHP